MGVKKEKKYWHEITDAEFMKLKDSKLTFAQAMKVYKQPDWCGYPGALEGILGCWTLIGRGVKSRRSCFGCEMRKDKSGNSYKAREGVA